MLKYSNPRIKELYNHKCELHSGNCIVLDKLTKNLSNKNITHLHILDASDIETQHYLDNLSSSLEYLEIFNLNYDLKNLPIGLKKLCIVSYSKSNIKIPFACEFIERIMNWDPTEHWIKTLGKNLIKSVKLEIGGLVIDEIDNNKMNELEKYDTDPNSHTGLRLDERTRIIYTLANY